MLVTALYNIVDQIFIGRGVGYLGNTATTVSFPIETLGLGLALLIGNGAAAFISLELGKGNNDKVKKTLGNSLTLLVSIGILFTVVILFFVKPILLSLGATDAVMPYATEYVQVITLGIPFNMIAVAGALMIRADGSPRYSMIATL